MRLREVSSFERATEKANGGEMCHPKGVSPEKANGGEGVSPEKATKAEALLPSDSVLE